MTLRISRRVHLLYSSAIVFSFLVLSCPLTARRRIRVEKVEWPTGTLHDLRRTYATNMAQHVDVFTLTRWFGHADPKTTMRFYHQTTGEIEEQARRSLAGRFVQHMAVAGQSAVATG